MTVALHLGWWLLPLAVSIAAFLAANLTLPRSPGDDYAGLFDAVRLLVQNSLAMSVSLVAWLIWALL